MTMISTTKGMWCIALFYLIEFEVPGVKSKILNWQIYEYNSMPFATCK
jgi:hypothetical protein